MATDTPLDLAAQREVMSYATKLPFLARCCAIDAFFSSVDEDPALHRCARRMIDHAFDPTCGVI